MVLHRAAAPCVCDMGRVLEEWPFALRFDGGREVMEPGVACDPIERSMRLKGAELADMYEMS